MPSTSPFNAPQPTRPDPAVVPVHPPVGVSASAPIHLASPPPPLAAQVVGQVLPIYFVGDESHSMSGDPIVAVNQGLVDLRDEVAKHPLIGKKVRFGIITFADTAQTRLELSELSEDLILPTLATRGRGTSYASAFEALRQTIPADVALLKVSGFQVHRPTVFFLSDGLPTERESKWQKRLTALKDPVFRERPNILAFGVGDADPKVIQQLATSPSHRVHDARGRVDRGRDRRVRRLDAQLNGLLGRAPGSRGAVARVREARGLRPTRRPARLAPDDGIA